MINHPDTVYTYWGNDRKQAFLSKRAFHRYGKTLIDSIRMIPSDRIHLYHLWEGTKSGSNNNYTTKYLSKIPSSSTIANALKTMFL